MSYINTIYTVNPMNVWLISKKYYLQTKYHILWFFEHWSIYYVDVKLKLITTINNIVVTYQHGSVNTEIQIHISCWYYVCFMWSEQNYNNKNIIYIRNRGRDVGCRNRTLCHRIVVCQTSPNRIWLDERYFLAFRFYFFLNILTRKKKMSFLATVVYIMPLTASYTYPIRKTSRFVNVAIVRPCVHVTDDSAARGLMDDDEFFDEILFDRPTTLLFLLCDLFTYYTTHRYLYKNKIHFNTHMWNRYILC